MSEASDRGQDPVLSDAYREDRARVVAALRRDDPVHHLAPMDAWLVTRHDLVMRLYTDPAVTNDRQAYAHYTPPAPGSAREQLVTTGLFSAPPEKHARMRGLVSKALTPRAVARMEAQVAEVVEQQAAPLRNRSDTIDFYAEFFEPIPNTVISRITGIPAKGSDEQRFRELGRLALSAIDPFLSEEDRDRAVEAQLELRDWVGEMSRARREAPRDDLISDLALACDLDDRLTAEEIGSVVSALLVAGTDTTVLGGTFGLRTLLHHPEVLEELRADRSLLPGAVNELLRFDFGFLDWIPRYALRDFELEGKPIRKGQLLLLSFLGANRDPAVFPDPDRLDVRRDTSRLAIFGHGPHYCLGANLARQELRCMLEAAIELLPQGSTLLEERYEERVFPLFRRLVGLSVAPAAG